MTVHARALAVALAITPLAACIPPWAWPESTDPIVLAEIFVPPDQLEEFIDQATELDGVCRADVRNETSWHRSLELPVTDIFISLRFCSGVDIFISNVEVWASFDGRLHTASAYPMNRPEPTTDQVLAAYAEIEAVTRSIDGAGFTLLWPPDQENPDAGAPGAPDL